MIAVVLCYTSHSGFRFTAFCLFTCMYALCMRAYDTYVVCPVQTGCSLHPSAHHMSWRQWAICVPDPWISVLPTVTKTVRLVRLENLDVGVAFTITLARLWCLRVVLRVTDGLLDGVACERVRCAIGSAYVVARGCADVLCDAVRGLCISGWLCSTGAFTTSFRATVGVLFHTCVRSSSDLSEASLTTGCLAMGSSRHRLAGTTASHSLSCMICCHGRAPCTVLYNRCRWLSHHTLGYCCTSICHATWAKFDSMRCTEVAIDRAFLPLAIANARTSCGAIGSVLDGYLRIWGFVVSLPLSTLFFRPHSTMLCSHHTSVSRKVKPLLSCSKSRSTLYKLVRNAFKWCPKLIVLQGTQKHYVIPKMGKFKGQWYSAPPDCRPGSYNFFPLSHVKWVLYSGIFEVGLILL